MGRITDIIAPLVETVASIAVPELALPIAAANFGENVASGNALGAGLSALGGLAAGSDLLDAGGENISGTNGVDNPSGTAGVDNISGTGGINNPSGTGGIDNPSGIGGAISSPSGVVSSNPSGVIGGNNVSGTSGINNISGTKGSPSSLTKGLKGASSAGNAAQTIASLVNGINTPTQIGGGTTFGSNIVQGNTGGSSVNQTGGFADRQLYDVVDAIKASFASKGQSGTPSEQEAIQQALAGTTG